MLAQLGALVTLVFAAGALKDRWPVAWLLKRLVAQPAEEVIHRCIADSPTAAAVSAIQRELHPNGGSSMRDAIDRTERLGQETAAEVRAIQRRQKRQQMQIAGHGARLADLADQIGAR